jgi:glycosyltransferase involved in cell wall biosynthesis
VPTVSVIIPTIDRPRLLRQALDSVLRQTYKDLEVIIVDDSQELDHLRNLKLSQSDSRVRYVHRKLHTGPAAARNAGIRMALGKYVGFLDDDDLWLPQKLERQVQFMSANENIAAAWCNCCFTNASEKTSDFSFKMKTVTREERRWRLYPPPSPQNRRRVRRKTLYESLLYRWVIKTSTLLIRRHCLMSVGLFDENLPTIEDQDLCRRLALSNTFGYLDEVQVQKRSHLHNLSSNAGLMRTGWLRVLVKIQAELPARFRNRFPTVVREIYLQIIDLSLREGDFTTAQPVIFGFAQRFGLLRLLLFIAKLVASSELTTLGLFPRSTNENARRTAITLAVRQSLNLAFTYHRTFANANCRRAVTETPLFKGPR